MGLVARLPVESAQVTVLGFGATARTRADGFYRIEQVPVGRWDILSEARQYRGYLKLGARIPGGPPIRLNFLLTPVAHVSGDTSPECESLSLAPVGIPGAGIDGIVTDSETGDPIVGAAVVVDGTDFGAPTDETGRYHIPEVPSGSWRLTTGAVGYYPKSQDSVEVRKHSGARVDFRLRFHPIDYRRSVQVR